MINLPVDEGYAYDVLAISEVKCIKKINSSKENFNLLFESLKNQVGNLHEEIINSVEYAELLSVNLETFDAVERARYGEISAKEVDNLNMKRFYSKIKLQNKFFPNSKLLEVKS